MQKEPDAEGTGCRRSRVQKERVIAERLRRDIGGKRSAVQTFQDAQAVVHLGAPDHEVEAIQIQAEVKVSLGAGPVGRVPEPPGALRSDDALADLIKIGLASLETVSEIFGGESVLQRLANSLEAGADQGDPLRRGGTDVSDDGRRVHEAAGDDILGIDGGHQCRCARVGGVDIVAATAAHAPHL
jgi:hypothetical protein